MHGEPVMSINKIEEYLYQKDTLLYIEYGIITDKWAESYMISTFITVLIKAYHA